MNTRKTATILYLLLLSGACVAWRTGCILLPDDPAAAGTDEDGSGARLERLRVEGLLRLTLKEEITLRFVNGELTLLQAAAEFYKVNHRPCEVPDYTTIHLPGDTEEERTCYQVISWASAVFLQDRSPEEAQAIIADLEYELTCQVRDHGQPLLRGLAAASLRD
jgi:hypothetical protein